MRRKRSIFQIGINIDLFRPIFRKGNTLPDHFAFSSNPFGKLDADIILITEKDSVKCAQIEEIVSDERIWVVPARVEIDNNDELERRIVEKCRECRLA